MAGFQHLVKDYIPGNSATIEMINRSTQAVTTPGTVLSDTLFLKHEAQGLAALVDGTVTLTSPTGKSAQFVVVAGGFYPYRFVQVKATGTSLAAAEFNLLYEPY